MAPRSKKRKPSFRKLLKTSSVKLDNKLKNRQFKQQNADKKQRKEQRKLRQAVRNISTETPRPLEVYKKRPEEEHDEEDFVESLPVDMMSEEDLEEIRALAQRASFLTRDLTTSGPVHLKKRKAERTAEEATYEKLPRRTNQPMEDKEVIHLLPIKDKTRLIPQSIERPVKRDDDEDEEDTGLEHFENEEAPAESSSSVVSTASLTAEQRERLRLEKLTDRKLRIAALASAITADPTGNIKRLKELRSMLSESDVCVAVSVRKLVMVSLMEVFKDITPSYRIRPLTDPEKNTKVKKDTQQLREFEEGLVSQYKFYLEDLEQVVKDWKQQKRKRSGAVGVGSYRTLAEVSVRCLCEMLLSLSHFNFHNNIIIMLVPLMIDPVRKVSVMCCEAVSKLFRQDKVGVASLGVVRVISGLVKSLNFNVRPQLLQVLLSLRIKEVEVQKDTEDRAPKMKKMYYKDKQKNLSRTQRKWKKAEEKLEKELLEAEATENKDAKIKLHTETLNIVFLIYFRILKKAPRPYLLPAVLEGLAKFAHLINLEFFDDLLNVLQGLIQSGELSIRENLHCIQTAFNILSGQGDVLNIDPLKFYSQLYETLLQLDAGKRNDDIIIVLRCLDVMLTRRRKQVTLQRAMAFVKRLSTLSTHTLPNATVGLLASCRALIHAFPRCDMLLDNESQGSGVYLPELNQPEYCNPQNTALWELHTLQKHYHPVVRRFACHLSRGAPSEGSGSLSTELSRRLPEELFEDYSFTDMTFNPAVSAPLTTKKDRFCPGSLLMNSDLQREVTSALSACQDTHTPLDFSHAHTHWTG